MNITASLQTKNNIYQVVLNYKDINGKRKQKWVSTGLTEKGNNKRLANQKMQEILTNFKEDLNCPNSKTDDKLFTTYLKEWLLSIKNTIEENTYDSYKVIVNKICDYFEDKKILLNDLKPVEIQKFYTFLYSKELTGNTVLHYHNVIRKALQTALKLDLILSNPADRVERPKKEQFIGSFYSQTELNTLFTLIKDDPLKLVIYLASFYGLRRSEVLGLKWEAFNFEDKTITIKHKAIETRKDNKRVILLKDKTKNQSSYRTLPLVDDIIVLLKEHQKQIDENKKLCGNSYNKKYLDYICVDSLGKLFRSEYVTDHFTLIMNKNKDTLRKIRFHDLRHSCASLLLAKGIPMKEIQDWLGHSTYSTTANIYAHLEKDTKNKSANVLSNVLTFTD
ncbi:MAG: site-specific integrase [Clostridia bacterium]|nr:site-specific integrase [Clostridia bacterium]